MSRDLNSERRSIKELEKKPPVCRDNSALLESKVGLGRLPILPLGARPVAILLPLQRPSGICFLYPEVSLWCNLTGDNRTRDKRLNRVQKGRDWWVRAVVVKLELNLRWSGEVPGA